MRILYTGIYIQLCTQFSCLECDHTHITILDCMLHNTLPNMAVQLYLFTFHLHKRCIIIILVEELNLLVHVLFCGALYQFHHHLS